jgi:hypothetical protein
MRGRRSGHVVIAAAIVAVAALVGVELQRGALTEDVLAVPDPCERTVTIDTGGLDGQTQRVGLTALDLAACELGTTREELLLDLTSSLQESRDFPPGTEDAIRNGLEEAIDREEQEDRLNVVAAFVLKQAVQRAPVEWVVRAVEEIGPLVG